MSTEINDGGPAFPLPAVYDSARDEVHAAAAYGISAGMSLRDYFAANVQLDIEGLSLEFAEKAVGRKCPRPSGTKAADPVEITLFWADAEAAYRYMRADAMLRARAAAIGEQK